MTHLDLFSGIGGFTLAAHWAGFETIGFSEVEPYCCALLEERWSGIKNYGDLRRADFDELRGRVDVLSAGVPCQPASLAGKRRGERDERWLWPATLDVVERVRPAWCLFENPDGILSLDAFRGVLLRLGTLGYQIRLFRVPANAVGAKHWRYRVFIVANCESERWSGLLERTQAPYTLFGSSGQTLADADGQGSQGRDQCGECAGQLVTGQGGQSESGNGQPESQLRRVADGFSSRLDLDLWRGAEMLAPLSKGERHRAARLKALGNAVVPQQAYPFFWAIAEIGIATRFIS